MANLHDLSAHELSQAYAARRISPVEVTRAALGRIEAWETKINAMYRVDRDARSRRRAASERRWTRRRRRSSPLDGVPLTIKENIAIEGVPAPIGTARERR